jgi:MoCo/4Fe-4S cofactor protein with predicted Tat translocation signal
MSSKQYWKGLDELNNSGDFVAANKNEFAEGLPLEEVFTSSEDDVRSNRRDFLKYFGFSVAAVTLAACNKTPVKKALPYAVKPDNVTPGVPLYYASSSVSDYEGLPILVKVREGRPIKFEPNKNATFFGEGIDGLANAAILSLYDTNRIKGPQVAAERGVTDWETLDKTIIAKLDATKAAGKKVAIVTRNNTSIVLNKAIEKFSEKYDNAEVVAYEPISYSGILRANNKSFGKAAIPTYNFDKADYIVSFDADFLGTWLDSNRTQSNYAKNRVPKDGKMSKHYQFESLMSLTGANADVRLPMRASKVGLHLLKLYNLLTGAGSDGQELAGNALKKVAEELNAAKGRSLVVCGSNDENDQILVNAINLHLNSYGNTIDLENTYNGCSIDEKDFIRFTKNASNYGAAIFVDVNPAYANGAFGEALSKIPVKISNALILDETAKSCDYLAPNTHALESWDLKQPYTGMYVTNQPTISPVFDGRNTITSLMAWTGEDVSDKNDFTFDYNFTKTVFEEVVGGDFNKAIEAGFVGTYTPSSSVPSFNTTVNEVISAIKQRKSPAAELVLYQKVGVKDGTYGNNPWAHEMPDPVSKVTWDNYVTMSKPDADKLGVSDDDVVKVSNGTTSVTLPVVVQPGQVMGTYGIALGYGRELPKTIQNDLKDLGANAYPFVNYKGDTASYVIGNISVEKTGDVYELARTQTHNSIEGRDIVRESSLEEYKNDPAAANHIHKPKPISLWEKHDYSTGHHWAMAIDLNKCNGCSACLVSCSIENNVPIVGRDEVRRRREMHWIRIDRYYSFEVPQKQDLNMSIVNGGDRSLDEGDYMTQEKVMEAYEDATESSDFYQNVKVVHQPMMCQHCDNAPCETVCPVLATTHSSEGLNQMTYNRCIGTKYCGNNCPYKVRRFNWFKYNNNSKFDYHFSNDLGKMVINPDVTVRSRGVMEKCSMCVQRIQSAKLAAKRDNRKMETDEFTVACAQSCPTNAIVFGDLNDENSEVAKLYKDQRGYHVIEELGTKPSVSYMAKVRNAESNHSNHNAH